MPTFWQKFLNRLDKIDRQRLERYLKNLSEEKDFYRSVFESISDGVVVLDEAGRVDFINEAARELLGLSPLQLSGRPLAKYLSDADLARLIDQKARSLEGATSIELSVKHPKKMLLDIKLVPRKVDGGNVGLVLVIRDITGAKQLESDSRQAEKLEALMTLAAGVAHEIGNPLNSLGIHMQLIGQELSKLPEKKRGKLENLVNVSEAEVKRLDGIIRQFLSVLRPAKLNLEEAEINQLLENVLDFMYYEMSEQNIAIVKSFGTKIPRIPVDPHQLRQAFFNIIKNAIEAMPEGGSLKVGSGLKGGDVVIDFTDDGAGIPKGKLSRIFDPYYTTKDSGSGLGLMIVYKIIKDHEGSIDIKSEPGQGTKVAITLPVFERKIGLLADKTKSKESQLVT